MKVSIAPQVVLESAAALSGLRGSLPSGSLPSVVGVGDHAVDRIRGDLEHWWRTMSLGTSEDLAALHQQVTSVAGAQVSRDREAAADIEKTGDPMAAFRTK